MSTKGRPKASAWSVRTAIPRKGPPKKKRQMGRKGREGRFLPGASAKKEPGGECWGEATDAGEGAVLIRNKQKKKKSHRRDRTTEEYKGGLQGVGGLA